VSWTRALLAVDDERTAAEYRRNSLRWSADPVAVPLAGDLFSVKDLFAVAGTESAAGSLLLRDFVPAVDATVVGRLRRAGATFYAKGNCAEFGFGIDTETRLGGRVLHPYDPEVSPGGSSGGDAVAVAAGVVDFGVAGDYGGSVRWPAQAVGVCGLRTSAGVLPRTGRIPGVAALPRDPAGVPAPWSLGGHLEVMGLLARSPAKIRDVLAVVAGPDGRDWFGLAMPLAPGPRTRRVLVTEAPEVAPVLPEVAGVLRRAAKALSDGGYEVDCADGLFTDAYSLYRELREGLDDHADVRALAASREDLLCDETRRVLAAAPRSARPRAELRTAWRGALDVADRVRTALATAEAVLLPVAPSAATGFGESVRIAGRDLGGHELMAHCRAVSLTRLPAMSVPIGTDARGHTLAVQIVGRPGADAAVCDLAEELGHLLELPWAAAPRAGTPVLHSPRRNELCT
jgi:Asp-tRNA(Asn)/Glu-tRNA(Gln) amidotransferase A subunit family amidase